MFLFPQKLALIEDFTRYDKSKIWSIHRDYFLNVGTKAWSSGEIPYSGISNYNEAYKKARLFIENLKVSESLPEEIRVLEVGGGYGVFAKNFIEAFRDICRYEKLDYIDRLVYFFTDFSQKTIDEVQASDTFKEFTGKVRFARFDASKEPEFIDYNHEDGYFDLIMANYLLDQLPARIIAKTNTGLKEKYIKLEDFEERINSANKPRKWVKKIKKTTKYLDLDIEIDHELPQKDIDVLLGSFRVVRESTVVYSYGALNAVKNFMNMLTKIGIILCSDFNAPAKPGLDDYDPCYYGNSIAQAVNYDFIFRYFADSDQKVMLYEDPIRPLHTMVLTRKDFAHPLELGEKYNLVYKQNLFIRMLYKYLVELKYSFWIFAIIMAGFLLKWIIFDLFASVF